MVSVVPIYSNNNTILNLFSLHSDSLSNSNELNTNDMELQDNNNNNNNNNYIYNDNDNDNSDNNITHGKRVKIPRSLSRLIYNLQIIETFLHSSKVEKVVEELDNIEDLEDEDLWIGMFLAYRGVNALEDALEYVIQQFTQYCQDSNSLHESYGITSKLLLYAMSLITKIFRAIMIRGVVCCCPNNFPEILFLVNSCKKVTIIDDKVIEIQQDGIKDKQIISTILHHKKVINSHKDLTENELLELKLNSIEEREEFISQEWGNRFNIPFDIANSISSDLIRSTVNLFHIQNSIYNFLLTIPKFCLESIFYQENNNQNLNLLSVRDVIHHMQNEYLHCIQNIFIIWGSVIILQPQITNLLTYNTTTATTTTNYHDNPKNQTNQSLQFETGDNLFFDQTLSAKDLLTTLLMNFPSIDLTTTTDVINQYSAIINESCVGGLLTFLKISEVCSNPCDYYLRNLFLQIILDIRPHLKILTQKQDDKLINNHDSFFTFATYLLNYEHQDKIFNFQEDKINTICQDIYAEMLSLYKSNDRIQNQNHGCSGKDYHFLSIQFFSGTMKLLQSLLQITSSAIDILLDQGIVQYLINICLGLQSIRSISLNILCNDPESRYYISLFHYFYLF